jgi:hypothetical protein
MGDGIMQRLVYTNSRGQSLALTNKAPFIVSFLSLNQDTSAEIQRTKAPYQDGTTYIDTLMNERAISFEITILTSDELSLTEKRQLVTQVFNPKLGEGVLRYEFEGGTREIDVTVDGPPVFPSGRDNRGRNYQKAIINLLCPSPFWMDAVKTSKQMSFIMGGFGFPWRLGSTKFSERTYKRVFDNQGDVSTPVYIEFYGPAVNPVITNNTTGEFVRVNRTLEETDKLVIDTTFGQKKVEIVHADGSTTNAFNWIDLDSTFFQLVLGDNEIEYNSNNDSTKSRVVISFKNRFLGV